VTPADFAAYQSQLDRDGYSATDVATMEAIDLTSDEQEYLRQVILAETAPDSIGSFRSSMSAMASSMRTMGQIYSDTSAAARAKRAAAGTNLLTSVNATSSTFTLGNPYATTTAITLKAR